MDIISIPDLENLVQSLSNRHDLTPEQKLAWSMIVLVIQDLHLEKHFSGIKKYYVQSR